LNEIDTTENEIDPVENENSNEIPAVGE